MDPSLRRAAFQIEKAEKGQALARPATNLAAPAQNDRSSPTGEDYRSVWRHLMEMPFKQGYLDVGGIPTRYVEVGDKDAPPVILVHGTAGNWEAFAANIGPLAEHFHVFALDLLGCGSSKPDRPYEIAGSVDQIRAFMDAMERPR